MMPEIDDDGNIKLKTILIGRSGVGKTNLINIAKNIAFNPVEESSVASSFFKTEMIIDNRQFNIYLWDTVGQEKLRSVANVFFKNSKLVILVYDITNKDSLEELSYWHKQVKDTLGSNIVLGVLANKQDLYLNEEVSDEEGQKYAESIGARWGITSAKTQRDSFITFIEDLVRDYMNLINPNKKEDKEKQKEGENNNNNIKLNKKNSKKRVFAFCPCH
jgi:small GTP-binding protein